MLGILFLLAIFGIIEIVLISLNTIGTIINTVGIMRIANKMKLKKYGLLWVPFVGAWYEGSIEDQLLGIGMVVRIVYLVKSLLSFAFVVALFVINDSSKMWNMILAANIVWFVVGYVVKGITQTIVMKKLRFNLLGAICINIFIQPFWSYFIYNNKEKGAVTVM